MTERKLIPCPICHGSTKEIQGVLACIANCRTQFWGLSQDMWYVGTQEDLDAANAKIAELTLRLKQVTDRHMFSIANPGTKVLGPDITDDMARAYFGTREAAQDTWKAMWTEADDDLFLNPATNNMLRRCIEISWERGFKGAHNSSPTARPEDIGTVIHCAFEELQRENPGMFKDLVPEQFSE